MSDSIPVRSVWVHVDEGKVIVETELEDGHYYEVISDFYGGDGCHVSHCVTSHGIREAQERGDLALWERVSEPAAGETPSEEARDFLARAQDNPAFNAMIERLADE